MPKDKKLAIRIKRTMRINDVLISLHEKAPREAAAQWDHVGLLVGDGDWKTTSCVVSVDLTDSALAAAKKSGAKLIVTHHPCIFTSVSTVTPGADTSLQSRVFQAVRKGIAVVACHTNFDTCALEVIDAVSLGLGVTPLGRLHDDEAGSLLKLVAFVPRTHFESVRTAICQAGAGQIGQYDSCTFMVPGEGTYRGQEGTKPFLGEPGRLERADEMRIETVLPVGLKSQVLAALRAAHPYEEIAYDLYGVHQPIPQKGLTRGLGYGFWGEFEKPITVSVVAARLKKMFRLDGVLLTPEDRAKPVKRIGFVPGKGSSFVSAACAAGCDLFITGEAGYHTALRGAGSGMSVMELGHVQSERFFLSVMSDWLKDVGLTVLSVDQPTQRFWSFS